MWLVYPGAKEKMTWESVKYGGYLTHGFTTVLQENLYNKVPARLLNQEMPKVIGKLLDLSQYPMEPKVDCINVSLDDDIKHGITNIDHILIMAIHPPEKENNLIGLTTETNEIFDSIVSICKPDANIVVITNDFQVKSIACGKARGEVKVLDPSKDAIMRELEDLKKNKGGSMLITMCHGDRVRDKMESDGYSCNLRITESPMPDKILTEAILGFEGKFLIGIFNHCYSRELADESKKLQPVLVPPVVQESPVLPVVQESPVPPAVPLNKIPPAAKDEVKDPQIQAPPAAEEEKKDPQIQAPPAAEEKKKVPQIQAPPAAEEEKKDQQIQAPPKTTSILARGVAKVKAENWSFYMTPLFFALTSLTAALVPKMGMSSGATVVQTILAATPGWSAMMPILTSGLCTVGPIVVGFMVLYSKSYSCILTETLVPLVTQGVLLLLNTGSLPANFVSSTPFVLAACCGLSIAGVLRTARANKKKAAYLSIVSTLVTQGANLMKAGDILTSGIYTDSGSNMTAMATFNNGFAAYYYPIGTFEFKNKREHCIIPRASKDGVKQMEVIGTNINHTIINQRFVATCRHDIFRQEVQRNLNGSVDAPYGSLALFRIGNITVDMKAFNDTKTKYAQAIGVIRNAERGIGNAPNNKDWMNEIESIEYNDWGEWKEPEQTWWMNLSKWQVFKVLAYVKDFLPNLLEVAFAILF